MLRKLILLCILSLLSVPVFASEADYEKQMARGVSALDTGDTALAKNEFRAALKEKPGDPDAALYLAITLNRAGDPDAESKLKTALRNDPGNPRINFELGTYYYNQKMYEESGDYFENLLTLKPDAEMKTAADSYLANIRDQKGGKRWSVTMMGGMQYDSNVPLAANGVQLPVGVNRKDDWRGIINLGLTVVPVRKKDTELLLSYSLYQSLHVNLNDFDLNQNTFDVTLKERLLPNLTGKISLACEQVFMGGRKFDTGYSISPGLTLTLAEKSATTVEYRYRQTYFYNSALFPTNSDRDGEIHTAQILEQLRLSEKLHLRFGYAFDKEETVVTAWGSDTHRGNAGVGIMLPYSLLLDLSGEVAGRRYRNIQPGANDIRNDTTVIGAAALTWQASSCCGISTGYHYTSNTSNIHDYEYNRGITSILLQGRF